MASITAYIGLGANLGDAQSTLRQAMNELGAWPGVHLQARSSLYTTAPVDADGPDYVNAVVSVSTHLSPIELLDALQSTEQHHLRLRPYRNAPRTLDLDLLLYGDAVIDTPHLSVPHPRMHERAFVLAPLLELDPDATIPGRGRAADYLSSVADQAITRLH
ncbi:MAG: folK [Rhizobacter sp.]|nr:folK [Rhizobacter sp.]